MLLWVDAAKLVDGEATTFEVSSKDGSGITENDKFTIELNDTSTFKNTESTPKAEPGFTLTDEFIQADEHKIFGNNGHFKKMLMKQLII